MVLEVGIPPRRVWCLLLLLIALEYRGRLDIVAIVVEGRVGKRDRGYGGGEG